jgi:hypothetical protein
VLGRKSSFATEGLRQGAPTVLPHFAGAIKKAFLSPACASFSGGDRLSASRVDAF